METDNSPGGNSSETDGSIPRPDSNVLLQQTGVFTDENLMSGGINLPRNDDDSLLVGCKKVENRTKYYTTTAGMLALIRPCGIVVNMTEMFTCESPTQVFLFLLRTFVTNTDSVSRLRYLGYDRACDLEPFLQNQAKRGSAGTRTS